MLRIVAELELISPADDEQVASPQLVACAVQLTPADGGFHEEKGDHVRGEPRALDVPVWIACELPEPVHLHAVAALVDEGPFVMMWEPEHG